MKMIPSINFHLWEPCNMRCKFCFATFQETKKTILPKGHLPKNQALEIVQKIADFGFEKITFVGGEPTLCPWLFDLVQLAKDNGLTTMLVTNGTQLNDAFFEKFKNVLDWITLSIDSLKDESNILSGRAITGKKSISKEKYMRLCQDVKRFGYRLKINSVIHQINYQEDFTDFIKIAHPERWKIFQVLPIKGENDACIKAFEIQKSQFQIFKNNHADLENSHIKTIFEDNNDMTATYVMIDPAGRFFDNSKGRLTYSNPILEVGIKTAFESVHTNYDKFVNRNGVYDWK